MREGLILVALRIVKSVLRIAEKSVELLSEECTGNAARVSRRFFLRLGVLLAAAFTPNHSSGKVTDSLHRERLLSFYNTHTGESLRTLYWSEGKYIPESLADVNYVLRDHRTDEVKPIDPRLLDLLYAVRTKLETSDPYEIISGYRSLQTNALLHENSRGVVKNSLHIYGKAADVRIPRVQLSELRRVAVSLRRGGVGYYPRPDFVHIDVGPVRYW